MKKLRIFTLLVSITTVMSNLIHGMILPHQDKGKSKKTIQRTLRENPAFSNPTTRRPLSPAILEQWAEQLSNDDLDITMTCNKLINSIQLLDERALSLAKEKEDEYCKACQSSQEQSTRITQLITSCQNSIDNTNKNLDQHTELLKMLMNKVRTMETSQKIRLAQEETSTEEQNKELATSYERNIEQCIEAEKLYTEKQTNLEEHLQSYHETLSLLKQNQELIEEQIRYQNNYSIITTVALVISSAFLVLKKIRLIS